MVCFGLVFAMMASRLDFRGALVDNLAREQDSLKNEPLMEVFRHRSAKDMKMGARS